MGSLLPVVDELFDHFVQAQLEFFCADRLGGELKFAYLLVGALLMRDDVSILDAGGLCERNSEDGDIGPHSNTSVAGIHGHVLDHVGLGGFSPEDFLDDCRHFERGVELDASGEFISEEPNNSARTSEL